jgi:hypothetical protein
MRRLATTLGTAAAIYVALTKAKRRNTPLTMTMFSDVLKEVWTSSTLEDQLQGEIMLDLFSAQREYNRTLTMSIHQRHRPRASSLPNGWAETWKRRQTRKANRRRAHFNNAISALLLTPPDPR